MKTEFIKVDSSSAFIERMFRHGTVSNTVFRDPLPEGYVLHDMDVKGGDVVFVFKHPELDDGRTRTLMPEWRTDV